MKDRKIIQISPIGKTIAALCDDGTLWVHTPCTNITEKTQYEHSSLYQWQRVDTTWVEDNSFFEKAQMWIG